MNTLDNQDKKYILLVIQNYLKCRFKEGLKKSRLIKNEQLALNMELLLLIKFRIYKVDKFIRSQPKKYQLHLYVITMKVLRNSCN